MGFKEYQDVVLSLRAESSSPEYARLGLAGETGELLGYFAKAIRDGFEIDRQHVLKELGDVLWFVAAIGKDNGYDLGDIAAANAAKLLSRKSRGTLQGSGDNR